MLRDADFNSFAAVYLVCGFTDLRLGMDSLAAIIETRYHLPVFVPTRSSFSVHLKSCTSFPSRVLSSLLSPFTKMTYDIENQFRGSEIPVKNLLEEIIIEYLCCLLEQLSDTPMTGEAISKQMPWEPR